MCIRLSGKRPLILRSECWSGKRPLILRSECWLFFFFFFFITTYFYLFTFIHCPRGLTFNLLLLVYFYPLSPRADLQLTSTCVLLSIVPAGWPSTYFYLFTFIHCPCRLTFNLLLLVYFYQLSTRAHLQLTSTCLLLSIVPAGSPSTYFYLFTFINCPRGLTFNLLLLVYFYQLSTLSPSTYFYLCTFIHALTFNLLLLVYFYQLSPRAHLREVGMFRIVFLHKPTGLTHSFYSLLASMFVFMTLSTVFQSINSPDNSPLSHSLLPVLFLLPTGSPSRGGDVAVYAKDINQPTLPTPFFSCSCVYFCHHGPFNCISFYEFFRQLSIFSLCCSGLLSALLVLSTIYLFMKVSLSPDIILCGWLGLKHQLTN